jgi:hypothetical protein
MILVVVPIRILHDLKSSPNLRRRLQTIFSITSLLTIACITQSVFVIKVNGLASFVTSLAEVSGKESARVGY